MALLRRRRRQDLHRARGGAPPGRARPGCGGGLRRAAWAGPHRRLARRSRGHAPAPGAPSRLLVRGDGCRCRARPAPPDRRRRRTGAHQRAGRAQREALAGRGGAAGRGHHRAHHPEHPAPRVAQRHRRAHHRGGPAGDDPRCRGARRRPDRPGRCRSRTAAPPPRPGRHLPAGADRCRPGPLLPGGQPHRPARADSALARRPGRRGAPRVHGPSRDPRAVGDPGAGGGGAVGPGLQCAPDPPGGAHGGPARRRPAGRAGGLRRRAGGHPGGGGGRPAGTDHRPGRHLPRGGRERRPQRPAPVRPSRERHAVGPGGEHPVAPRRDPARLGGGPGGAGCRAHRRAHHLAGGAAGGDDAPAPTPAPRHPAAPAGARAAWWAAVGLDRAHPGADRGCASTWRCRRSSCSTSAWWWGSPPWGDGGRPSPGRWRPSCWSTGTSCRRCITGTSARPRTPSPWGCSWRWAGW